jgi:hypothetical protein
VPVRLVLELGPDQLLTVDVDDLLAVLQDPAADPVVWHWKLPGGAVLRLRAAKHDTPNADPAPEH